VTKEQARILANVESAFVPLAQEIFAGNLASIILYGSAVKGFFTDGISDVNVLILIDNESPDSVVAFGRKSSRIVAKNRISPLVLTVQEFVSSADVFPMEYLDIRSSRKVLFGADITERLEITKANLRHQVEAELRGSITSIRRSLLYGRGTAASSKRLLRDWFGAQNALFRGVLRLKGEEEVPLEPEGLAEKMGAAFGISTGILADIARYRRGTKSDPAALVKGLLAFLTELVRSVDSMDT